MKTISAIVALTSLLLLFVAIFRHFHTSTPVVNNSTTQTAPKVVVIRWVALSIGASIYSAPLSWSEAMKVMNHKLLIGGISAPSLFESGTPEFDEALQQQAERLKQDSARSNTAS